MISHTFLGVTDFEAAFRLHGAVMAELGNVLRFRDEARPWSRLAARFGRPPLFLIGRPDDGAAAAAGNGQMVALLAPSRAAVDAAHAAALAHGAHCAGPPGLRPHYHADYYGAYFRDLDGNKLCVCCHDPA